MAGPSAAEIVAQARAHAAAQPSGRLPLPAHVTWSSFPFEGDLQVKALDDVELPEPPRGGSGGVDCGACAKPDSEYLWCDADWRLTSTKEPTGLPVVLLLEPRAHHDLEDLPPHLVAAMGPMLVRVERAISTSLDHVGRVHVARYGDGAEHLHWWFMVRPAGFVQGRGSFLVDWDDLLPPRPVEEWHATLAAVRAAMDASTSD